MAARNLSISKTLDRDIVWLFGGATGNGAADMVSPVGPGIVSVTRTGVGLYTITLADKWNKLLLFDGQILSSLAAGAWDVVIVAEAVATAKTIQIAIFKANVATEPASTEKLKFGAVMSNTGQAPTAR